MRPALGVVLAAIALGAGGCGSSSKPAPPPKVEQFQLNSKLMGRPLYETLVTPAGGGKGRPLLVFLHGYGAAPSDTRTATSLARVAPRAYNMFATFAHAATRMSEASDRITSPPLRKASKLTMLTAGVARTASSFASLSGMPPFRPRTNAVSIASRRVAGSARTKICPVRTFA